MWKKREMISTEGGKKIISISESKPNLCSCARLDFRVATVRPARGLPGGAVVKTNSIHLRGQGSIPGQGF